MRQPRTVSRDTVQWRPELSSSDLQISRGSKIVGCSSNPADRNIQCPHQGNGKWKYTDGFNWLDAGNDVQIKITDTGLLSKLFFQILLTVDLTAVV